MPEAPILKVKPNIYPKGRPITQYAMAISIVGNFTSLIPRNKPAPIACVLSDIWNTAANNNNRPAV